MLGDANWGAVKTQDPAISMVMSLDVFPATRNANCSPEEGFTAARAHRDCSKPQRPMGCGSSTAGPSEPTFRADVTAVNDPKDGTDGHGWARCLWVRTDRGEAGRTGRWLEGPYTIDCVNRRSWKYQMNLEKGDQHDQHDQKRGLSWWWV